MCLNMDIYLDNRNIYIYIYIYTQTLKQNLLQKLKQKKKYAPRVKPKSATKVKQELIASKPRPIIIGDYEKMAKKR